MTIGSSENLAFSLGGFSFEIDGTLVVGSDGVAASLTVSNLSTSLSSLSGLGVGNAKLELNTFTRAVSSPALPAGPFLRLSLDNLTVTVDIGGDDYEVTGDALVEVNGTRTLLVVSDVSIAPAGAPTGDEVVEDASGVLVVRGAGIAGVVTGTIEISGNTVQVGVRFNSTGIAIDESFVVGGVPTDLVLGVDEFDVFGDAGFSFDFGGLVQIQGQVTLGPTVNNQKTFAAVNAVLFIGHGPYLDDDGEVNPTARGIVLRNARVGVVFVTTTSKYAVVATGTIELVGVGGVTLSGSGRVEFNNTGLAINRTIPVGSDGVLVSLGAANTNTFRSTALRLETPGLRLDGAVSILAPSIAGASVGIDFEATTVRLAGGLVVATNVDGIVEVGADGIRTNGTVTAGPITIAAGSGVSLTATTTALTLDTTTATPSLGLSLTGATLTVAGVVSLAGTINLVAVGGAVALGISSGSVDVGPAAGPKAVLTGITGTLLVDAGGTAGRLAVGSTSFTGATDFAATAAGWSVAISNRATAIDTTFVVGTTVVAIDLPAGPYVRVAADDITITLDGAAISADVVLERRDSRLAVAVSGASLSVAGGLVEVRNAGGLLVVSSAGVALRATGTIVTDLPAGVDLSGTASIVVNSTNADQSVALTVGGQALVLEVAASQTLAVSVSGAVIQVAGVRITAAQLDLVES
ncbi:MAG TPA: hypothetical protein VGK49_03650, partial [Ilumatobacteraceae bacterium]